MSGFGSLKELSVVGCPGEFKPLVSDDKMRLISTGITYEQQLANSILTMKGLHTQIVDKRCSLRA